MIIYGSHALRAGFKARGLELGREPADLDILASREEARDFIELAHLDLLKMSPDGILSKSPTGQMVEIEYIVPGTSNALYFLWAETIGKLDTIRYQDIEIPVASLEMMYSIKRAHRHSPRFFEKHVKDYNRLRKLLHGQDVFEKVTALRYKETVEKQKLRTPSLNKTTKDFFDDKVSNRTFIHDQIHEVMAFGERPMFERIKIDPDKVACSKEKFNALHYMERIRCVQEEAYVIALERAIIPMLFEGEGLATPLDAYKWAVKRICTTLSSGWFREFALENYEFIMGMYGEHYVDEFLKAVESGRIERIK
jgi:hypothetical protein